MSDERRLWDVHHPYYCSESNFYVGGVPKPRQFPLPPGIEENFLPWDHQQCDSWEDFDGKDWDMDWNLLFRWDWKVPDPDDYEDDEELPGERMVLFWMQQRKGRFMITSFPVEREEEPEIRAWLRKRYEHMQALWEPFSGPAAEDKQ